MKTSTTEKITDRRQFLGMMGAGAALTALAWPQASLRAQRLPERLVIGWPDDLPSWNPLALTLPSAQTVYATVFDSPLRYSDTLQLQPRQIAHWVWQDTTRQRLAVTLRDDIRFHNGDALTTRDLRFSLLELPAQDARLAVRAMFPALQDIEILSPTQAVLVYAKPQPTAPIFLGFLAAYLLPADHIKRVGMDGFTQQPIGAGPYRVVQYRRGSSLTLQAWEGYWGDAPAVKQVTVLFTPEASSRVALVESGRAALTTGLPIREAQRLQKNPALVSEIYPVTTMYMLKLPSYVAPLEKINVRRALHLAIDKAAISRALYADRATPLSVLAIPGAPDHVADYNFPFDREQAIALLASEGYGPRNPVRLRLLATNGAFANDWDLARVLTAMWKQVGIEVTAEETTTAKAMEQAHNRKINGMILYSWVNATGDPDNGIGRVLDPRLRFATWLDDALAVRIDALFTETDEARRIQGYQALQRDSSENSWVIPLLQGVDTLAHDARLNVPLRRDGYLAPETYAWKT